VRLEPADVADPSDAVAATVVLAIRRMQLAARQVLAFLDSLEHRAIAVAPIIFFPDRSKGFERQPEAFIRATSGRKSRPPKSPRRDKPTAKLWPASYAGANVDRPAFGLLITLVMLRVSSGWLPK
jgi:hypothetical protein